MVFVSDRQRKAVMAKLNQGNLRSDVRPQIIPLKAGGDIIGDKAPITAQEQPTPAMQQFLSQKIRKNISEGKPTKQAIAIAFSQARKKFGNGTLRSPKERIVIKKLQRIIPKLSKQQKGELRQIVLKKLKDAKKPVRGFLLGSPEANFKVISKKGRQIQIEITRGNLQKTGLTRGDRLFVKRNEVFLSNPGGSSKIPLANIIPLLIGLVVITAVLRAAQKQLKN